MKTMKWLVRREFWEHKGSFFWAPAVVAAVMTLFVACLAGYSLASDRLGTSTVTVNGTVVHKSTALKSVPAETRAEVVDVAANSYLAVAVPLFGILAGVAFMYCLGALYDERRDRSILFWKSLPASDQATVLSKVAMALAIAPLITVAIAIVMSLALLFIGTAALAFTGVNLFGMLLSSPDLYLAPLRLVGMLPVYVLWALPTVGWLLMVSAWARSKVFLWAVGAPLVALAIVQVGSYLLMQATGRGLAVERIFHDVIARGLGGLVPGSWFVFEQVPPAMLHTAGQPGLDLGAVFTQSWLTLAGPSAWIGAAAGAAMIFAAMRLRRWRDEL